MSGELIAEAAESVPEMPVKVHAMPEGGKTAEVHAVAEAAVIHAVAGVIHAVAAVIHAVAAESVPEPGEGIESAEPGIIMGMGEGVEGNQSGDCDEDGECGDLFHCCSPICCNLL